MSQHREQTGWEWMKVVIKTALTDVTGQKSLCFLTNQAQFAKKCFVTRTGTKNMRSFDDNYALWMMPWRAKTSKSYVTPLHLLLFAAFPIQGHVSLSQKKFIGYAWNSNSTDDDDESTDWQRLRQLQLVLTCFITPQERAKVGSRKLTSLTDRNRKRKKEKQKKNVYIRNEEKKIEKEK